MNQNRVFVVLMMLALTMIGPFQAQASASPEDSILNTVLAFYAASTNGDITAMDALYAHTPEVTFLGTDASEVFVGHDEIIAAWAGLFEFLAGQGYPNNGGLVVTQTGNPIQVERRGSVAWVTDHILFQFANGDVSARLSLVLILEQGTWTIAQSHFSIGVPNDQLPI